MGSSFSVSIRRHLHEWPELGFLEFVTANTVQRYLREYGFDVLLGHDAMIDSVRMGVPSDGEIDDGMRDARQRGVDAVTLGKMEGGMTAVVGRLAGSRPGPHLGFRFDMDALPIEEASHSGHRPVAEAFRSKRKGVMHACGHDGHVAVGLGLARELRDRDFAGEVTLLFQPAEEGLRGARAMVAAGTVDGLDRLYGLHLGQGVPTGVVYGGTTGTLAAAKVRCVFHGRAAHAAMEPEYGRHAVLAASSAALTVHSIAQYGGTGARVNVGALHGGHATNIVPPEAEVLLEVRHRDQPGLDALMKSVEAALGGAGSAFGTSVQTEVIGSAPSFTCDEERAEQVCQMANLTEGVIETSLSFSDTASEDYAWMLRRVQERGGTGTYVLLGSATAAGHHTDIFDFDERSLDIGITLLRRIV